MSLSSVNLHKPWVLGVLVPPFPRRLKLGEQIHLRRVLLLRWIKHTIRRVMGETWGDPS